MGEPLDRVVGMQVSRIRMVYPATSWTKALAGEYERVFRAVGDGEMLERVVTKVVDENEQRFCPPPGVFVRVSAEMRSAYRRRPGERQSIDELALRDAYQALEDVTLGRGVVASLFSREEMEAQVESIRKRLGRA